MDSPFKLDKAIAKWRRDMAAHGVKSSDVLDELENHLRESVQREIRAGAEAEEAFKLALRQIGEPKAIRTEFSKAQLPLNHRDALRKATIAGLAAILLLSAVPALWLGAKSDLWYAFHVFLLVAGYGTLLFAGCIGMYAVVRDAMGQRPAADQGAIGRSAVLCYSVALWLISIGLLVGAIWLRMKTERMWGGNREGGTVLVLAWVVGSLVTMRFWKSSDRAAALVCIGGSIATCIGWFAVTSSTAIFFSSAAIFFSIVTGILWLKFRAAAKWRKLLHPAAEQYTDLAQRATDLAHEEARRFGHDFVGTEHLLLGVIACDSGLLSDLLRKWQVDAESVCAEIEKVVGPGRSRKSSRDLAYTPRASKALNFAMQEMQAMGHSFIAPEHIMLGLLLEKEGVAGLVLRQLGLDADRARRDIFDRMGPGGDDSLQPVLA